MNQKASTRILTESEQNELRAQHVALVNLQDEINTATMRVSEASFYVQQGDTITLRRIKGRTPEDKPEWTATRSVKIHCHGRATVGED
jgi:hypothetical protein